MHDIKLTYAVDNIPPRSPPVIVTSYGKRRELHLAPEHAESQAQVDGARAHMQDSVGYHDDDGVAQQTNADRGQQTNAEPHGEHHNELPPCNIR